MYRQAAERLPEPEEQLQEALFWDLPRPAKKKNKLRNFISDILHIGLAIIGGLLLAFAVVMVMLGTMHLVRDIWMSFL